jgi:hypothetical protein
VKSEECLSFVYYTIQDLTSSKRRLPDPPSNSYPSSLKNVPLAQLREKPGILRDKVGGKPIQIEVAPDGEVLGVRDAEGIEIPSIFAYWFAWQAFHPNTTVYREKK